MSVLSRDRRFFRNGSSVSSSFGDSQGHRKFCLWVSLRLGPYDKGLERVCGRFKVQVLTETKNLPIKIT